MSEKRSGNAKTRLKHALIGMLDDVSFSRIAITDLCSAANVARITFYLYYADKFELIEEIMDDYFLQAEECFHALQETKLQKDERTGYEDLLESILQTYEAHPSFFRHVSLDVNPYLYASFYRRISAGAEAYLSGHIRKSGPKSSPRQLAALLCGGLGAMTDRCYSSGVSVEAAHAAVLSAYKTLLTALRILPAADKTG